MKIDFGTKLIDENGVETKETLGGVLSRTFYLGNIGKGRLSFRLYQLSGTCAIQELDKAEGELLTLVAESSTGQIYDAYERSIVEDKENTKK